MLVKLDREHSEQHPSDSWEDFYARELAAHFAAAD